MHFHESNELFTACQVTSSPVLIQRILFTKDIDVLSRITCETEIFGRVHMCGYVFVLNDFFLYFSESERIRLPNTQSKLGPVWNHSLHKG